MSLPLYADLGKIAKDLFNKGFNHENIKIEAKTKAPNGNDFNLTSEYKSNKLVTILEAKYKNAASGVALVKKLGSDNSLKSELTLEKIYINGLKIVSDANFKDAFSFNTECTYVHNKNLTLKGKYSLSPKQEHSGVLKSAYKQENFLVNTDVDLNKNNPAITNSLVVTRLGWIFGLESSFNPKKFSLTKKNVSIGYQDKDFCILSYLNGGTDFGAYIYKLVNINLDLGVSVVLPLNKEAMFGIALKYKLDKNSTLQVKVNNLNKINLAYSNQIRDGVKLAFSSLIDANNLNGGQHKIGVGLELNA